MKKSRIIGILGGMGPHATIAFYQKLLDLTPVKKEWDYYHTIIDSNPRIPSRTRAFLFNEASPVPEMIRSAERLIKSGADILTLPCNSAHYFLPEVEKVLNVKFINMIDATVGKIVEMKFKKVGIIAGEVTVDGKLYDTKLATQNIKLIHVRDGMKKDVRGIIDAVKHNCINDKIIEKYENIAYYLKSSGAETVILGCTELGSVAEKSKKTFNTIDSVECLAKATIQAVKAKEC